MDKIEFLSLREYAERMNVSKETVRNMCKYFPIHKKLFEGGFIPAKVDSTWILYRFHK